MAGDHVSDRKMYYCFVVVVVIIVSCVISFLGQDVSKTKYRLLLISCV